MIVKMLGPPKSKSMSNFNKIAIISGEGKLPQLIFKEVEMTGAEACFFYPHKITAKIPKNSPFVYFNPLDIEGLFLELSKRNIFDVVFAGKITRSINNYALPDDRNNIFSSNLKPVLQETDDKVLRKIGVLFENHGFNIRGVLELLPASLASGGVLTSKEPSLDDKNDIIRAVGYQKILSKSDIGQSVIVANGLCLGLETLPGTDAMLDFVKGFKNKGQLDIMSGGVLYKGIKSNQDTRFDVPVIGLTTIEKVKKANLEGIALQKDTVVIIEKDKVIKLANKLDIFITAV